MAPFSPSTGDGHAKPNLVDLLSRLPQELRDEVFGYIPTKVTRHIHSKRLSHIGRWTVYIVDTAVLLSCRYIRDEVRLITARLNERIPVTIEGDERNSSRMEILMWLDYGRRFDLLWLEEHEAHGPRGEPMIDKWVVSVPTDEATKAIQQDLHDASSRAESSCLKEDCVPSHPWEILNLRAFFEKSVLRLRYCQCIRVVDSNLITLNPRIDSRISSVLRSGSVIWEIFAMGIFQYRPDVEYIILLKEHSDFAAKVQRGYARHLIRRSEYKDFTQIRLEYTTEEKLALYDT